MFDKTIEAHLLYDYYGALLTPRQRKTVELRFFEDWSLAEIAEELGISRQAVHDVVRRTLAQLTEYEQRLGFLAAAADRRKRILEVAERLRSEYGVGEDLLDRLQAIVEGNETDAQGGGADCLTR
ncbi:MAG: YlxM family DNA-binding protein [Bacilli bacterium]